MRVRRPLGLLLATTLATAVVFVVPSAQAYSTLDQSVVVPSSSHLLGSSGGVGQTFTVGVAGDLERVDVNFYAARTDPVVAQIYPVNGSGLISGTSLASLTYAAAPAGWASADVTPALEVEPGDEFAVGPFNGMWMRAALGEDSDYDRGHGLLINGLSSSIYPDDVDMQFRTYVDDDRVAPGITGTPPTGERDYAYDFTYDLTGAPAPTVSVTSGSLPEGLTLDPDGRLHGTPTEDGEYDVTIEAVNGTEPAAIESTIEIEGVVAFDGSPGPAVLGEEYSYAFALDGWPEPEVTLDGGVLPPGIEVSEDGVLSGTPTVGGQFAFTLLAENDSSFMTLTQTIRVYDHPTLSGDVPAGLVGDAYDFTFTTDGDPEPETTVTAGSLPAGLELELDGRLHGTPTMAGDYEFTVSADNGSGEPAERVVALAIDELPAISGSAPIGVAGSDYDHTFDLVGTPEPETTVTSGELPEGLELTTDGRLHGIPVAAGTYDFVVTATSSIGSDAIDVTLTVLPGAASEAIVSGGDRQSVEVGVEFDRPLTLAVTDAQGNPISGANVTFEVTTGDASFGGSPTSLVTTDENGVATSGILTAGTKPGDVVVIASVWPTSATQTAVVPDAVATATYELTVLAAEDDAGDPGDTGAGDELADTGADVVASLQATVLLLGLGLVLVLGARRRAIRT